MPDGHVLMFKKDKGYGFIKPDDGSDNVYVHISAIETLGLIDLAEGQKLSYDIRDEGGKVSATNLNLIK